MLQVINAATSSVLLSQKDFPDVASAARKDRGNARCRRNVLEGWTICDAESSSDEEWLFCDEVEDLNHDTEDKPSYASIAKEHIGDTTAAVPDNASSEDEAKSRTQETSPPKSRISTPAAVGPKVATQSQAAEMKAERPARSSRPPKQSRGSKKTALTGDSDEEFIEWKEQRRLRRRTRRGGC